MAERQDAMIAAAQLTLAVREAVMRKPGRQVGTVGKIEITPERAERRARRSHADHRAARSSTVTLDSIAEEIRARAAAIATETRTTIQLTPASANPPAFADTAVQDVVERAAQSLNLSTVRMPSGAGHDAQMMAQLTPMGMIFVPSIGGISHSPKELTRWEDCANGANVLLQSVLSLDRA